MSTTIFVCMVIILLCNLKGHLLYAIGTGNIMCAPTIIPASEEGE